MIEAPVRAGRKSFTQPVVDMVESIVTPSPVLEEDSSFVLPPELIRYLLSHQSLVLCERPATGTFSLLRDLLKEYRKRILIVTTEPKSLLATVNSEHVLCDADERFRRSTLIADASRFLQSQLTSEQAELQADAEREAAIQAVKTRLQSHENQTSHHLELAEQRVKQSAVWLIHLARQQHQTSLRSQIESLSTQLTQPVGLLQRLLGRGTAAEQQNQLAVLQAKLLHSTSQSIPENDLFQTLLAAEIEQIQKEAHAHSMSLQAELAALPAPILCTSDRQQKQLELNARFDALPRASEEYVWTNRRIVIASPTELSELDRPGHFDKWILDVAEATPELLRQCNRLGRSGLFLGEVPTLRPPGYRNGSVLTTPTLFHDTWNECVTDVWALEGMRLIAQTVRLPIADRAKLIVEPIIGLEQHEARLHDDGTVLVLAEVAFAPGTCIAQAAQLLIDETELACLSTIGPIEWTINSGKHTARLLSTKECESVSVANGWVDLSFYGYHLAQAQFDQERFPTQSEAEQWLSGFVRCWAPTCVRTRVV